MAKITLYQFESCPFCAKVRAKLDQLKLEYEKVDVSRDRSDPQRVELHKRAGVYTVPVADIDGKLVGESDVIIQELEKLAK